MDSNAVLALLASYAVVIVVFYVLLVVALCKIFHKAGKGWGWALCPVVNLFMMAKIAGDEVFKAYIIYIIAGVVVGIISAISADAGTICSAILGIAGLALDIFENVKLAKAFGKGTGFAVGLILLPNIFLLILGFSKNAEYQK